MEEDGEAIEERRRGIGSGDQEENKRRWRRSKRLKMQKVKN